MILSSLELAPKLEEFKARARDMSAEAFAEQWPLFLAEVQDCL
jgi:hypothetical protein